MIEELVVKHVDCGCFDYSHTIRLSYCKEEDFCFCSIDFYFGDSLWKRIKSAFNHIFKRGRPYYGDFCEVTWNKEQAKEIAKMLNDFAE